MELSQDMAELALLRDLCAQGADHGWLWELGSDGGEALLPTEFVVGSMDALPTQGRFLYRLRGWSTKTRTKNSVCDNPGVGNKYSFVGDLRKWPMRT